MTWMRLGFMIVLAWVFAQGDIENDITSQSIEKDFLIVKTTTSYNEARKFVESFSQRSAISINLRALTYQDGIGLTPTKEECRQSGFSYPCYVPRGRYDDGNYLSIESSSNYAGFTKGYFIVVASTGKVDNTFFLKIKHLIPDAYIKKSWVYMGCIH